MTATPQSNSFPGMGGGLGTDTGGWQEDKYGQQSSEPRKGGDAAGREAPLDGMGGGISWGGDSRWAQNKKKTGKWGREHTGGGYDFLVERGGCREEGVVRTKRGKGWRNYSMLIKMAAMCLHFQLKSRKKVQGGEQWRRKHREQKKIVIL